jgi:hypothetical protein
MHRFQRDVDELRKIDTELRCPDLLAKTASFNVKILSQFVREIL